MKHLTHILLTRIGTLAALMALTAACTHNNGDIGPLFGTWHLSEATANGNPIDLNANITAHETANQWFFQFQSSIIAIRLADDVLHNEDAAYGHWEQPDNKTMIITFPDPSVFYIRLPGIEAENRFIIDTFTDNQLIISRTADDGTIYRYTLNKLR